MFETKVSYKPHVSQKPLLRPRAVRTVLMAEQGDCNV